MLQHDTLLLQLIVFCFIECTSHLSVCLSVCHGLTVVCYIKRGKHAFWKYPTAAFWLLFQVQWSV